MQRTAMRLSRFVLFLMCSFIYCSYAFAKVANSGSGQMGESGSSDSAAFVEWNPAAIKDNTVDIAGEYLVIDGVSFGALVKFTDRERNNVSIQGLSLGGSLAQYFFSSRMTGLFAKGDFSMFSDRYKSRSVLNTAQVADFEPEGIEESGYVFGASLGVVAGYRFMFADHITGSAGYGVVRNLPEFFGKRRSSFNGSYFGDKGDWRFNVLAGIGVSF